MSVPETKTMRFSDGQSAPSCKLIVVDKTDTTCLIITPELRAYLVERRRALLTELKSLDKLLGMTTK